MDVGTVVIAQRDFKVPDEEPIILGTFGIVVEDYGKALMVHFKGCRMPVDVNSLYVTPLANDNWNDHILRTQAELTALRNRRAETERQLALTERDFAPLRQDYGRLLEFVERVANSKPGTGTMAIVNEFLKLRNDARELLSSLTPAPETKRDPPPT